MSKIASSARRKERAVGHAEPPAFANVLLRIKSFLAQEIARSSRAPTGIRSHRTYCLQESN
jgi:hypothetical protein